MASATNTVQADEPAEIRSNRELPAPSEDGSKLLERGDVRFAFYERRPPGQRYDGETHFNIKIAYQFRQRGRRIGSGTSAVYRSGISFSKIEILIDNEIRLPSSLVDERFWSDRLVMHELEHVRINSDPRIKLLATTLIRQIRSIEIPLTGEISALDAWTQREAVDKQIAKTIEARVDKVADRITDLVQKNNDLLDSITRHGVTTLQGDPNFFNRLFSQSNLEDTQFDGLEDLKSLLRSKKYQEFAQADANEIP